MASTHPEQPAVPVENFRSRVARERRAQMHERLINATMDAYLLCEPGRTPVIDDVIRLADVSRGTFYKYFDSVDAVLGEIGRRTADEMLDTFGRIFGADADPATRLAAGPLMALIRALMEPRHGAFISRVDFVEFFGGSDPRRQWVERSIQDAHAMRSLDLHNPDAAVDLIIGATVEGTRRILRTPHISTQYVCEMTTMLLLAFGMPRQAAGDAVSSAWNKLSSAANTLSWWKTDHVN